MNQKRKYLLYLEKQFIPIQVWTWNEVSAKDEQMLKWTTLTSVEILLDIICPVSSTDYVRENHSKRISLLLLFTKIKIDVWKNWNIESHENMIIHECCLSSSLYVSSDIMTMSKARMWKKSKCITLYIIYYLLWTTFFSFSLVKSKPARHSPDYQRNSDSKQKSTSFAPILTATEPAEEIFVHFLFSDQLVFSLQFPHLS